MDILKPPWDPKSSAGDFVEKLTEWERRITDFENETLERIGDGTRVDTLAMHAPEGIQGVMWMAAGPANGNWKQFRRAVKECIQFGRYFSATGERVGHANLPTPMEVDVVSARAKAEKERATFADTTVTLRSSARRTRRASMAAKGQAIAAKVARARIRAVVEARAAEVAGGE